jgi:hypothetical protein
MDENGDLLADSHNILNRWKSYFTQLLNVHNITTVRPIEIRTAEPLVPGPSHLELEIAIAKLKEYKYPRSDQIPAELIPARGEILVFVIHKRINSICNKEELPDQWKDSIIKIAVFCDDMPRGSLEPRLRGNVAPPSSG